MIWDKQTTTFEDIKQHGTNKFNSLSDYHIHKTANIENGYLAGRYGGIPFLSNDITGA